MAKNENIKWKYMKLNGVLNRKYKVSSAGDIVLTKGMVPLPQRDMCKKSAYNGTDYKCVKIHGIKSAVRVHRIVCETFHGQSKQGQKIVRHTDERKDNNNADNVKWGTQRENVLDYYALHAKIRHPISTIKKVKKLVNRGWTNDRIAMEVKMSDSNVSLIKLGRTHADVEPYTLDQWL